MTAPLFTLKREPCQGQITSSPAPMPGLVSEGNEALNLTVYCHAAVFILQHFIELPTHRDLSRLAALVSRQPAV